MLIFSPHLSLQVGEDGAGHYVKMVHNGIEYGDMQLICEAYQLMKDALGMTTDEMSGVTSLIPSFPSLPSLLPLTHSSLPSSLPPSLPQVFKEWNKGELDSFLIEITTDIMAFKDTDGKPLVEKIRDSAGQKGTGKWTAISALDKGMPVTLIG